MQDILAQTTVEYSQASSLHGLQYICEGGRKHSVSRVIWLVAVITAAIFGIVWSVQESNLANVASLSQTTMQFSFFVARLMMNGNQGPLLTTCKQQACLCLISTSQLLPSVVRDTFMRLYTFISFVQLHD